MAAVYPALISCKALAPKLTRRATCELLVADGGESPSSTADSSCNALEVDAGLRLLVIGDRPGAVPNGEVAVGDVVSARVASDDLLR